MFCCDGCNYTKRWIKCQHLLVNSLIGVDAVHQTVYSARMELKKFISSLPVDKRELFASRCATSFAHLRNIAYGLKTAGESLCINIERETSGAVRCEELRPDVDWAFLRGTSKSKPKKAA